MSAKKINACSFHRNLKVNCIISPKPYFMNVPQTIKNNDIEMLYIEYNANVIQQKWPPDVWLCRLKYEPPS
jgi:hypothetical protein